MAILQAAALVEDGDIPRDDGLLNPGGFAPGPRRFQNGGDTVPSWPEPCPPR